MSETKTYDKARVAAFVSAIEDLSYDDFAYVAEQMMLDGKIYTVAGLIETMIDFTAQFQRMEAKG